MRLPLLLACLLLVASPALAQVGPPVERTDRHVEQDTVWDTPQQMDRPLVVDEDVTLTIRGTTLDMGNFRLTIMNRSRVVLESVGESAAELRGGPGWETKVYGDLVLRGTEEAPVVLYGIGGRGSNLLLQGGSVGLFSTMVVAGGNLTGQHAKFLNYTGGVLTGANATLDLDHVTFSSPYGGGIATSLSTVRLRNAHFEGFGGNAFFSISSQPVVLENLTFVNSSVGLGLRDVEATVRGVRSVNSGACLLVAMGGWTKADVRDVECEGFLETGIRIDQRSGLARGHGSLRLDNVRVATDAAVTQAIELSGDATVHLANATVGPLPHAEAGIVASGRVFNSTPGLTFRGVEGWNVIVSSPPADLPRARLGEGEPGGKGWLKAVQVTNFLVQERNSDRFLFDADVTVREEATGEVVLEGRTSQAGLKGELVIFRIDPQENVTSPTYRLTASRDGQTGERIGFRAGAPVATIRLGVTEGTPGGTPTSGGTASPPPSGRDTPGPALPLVLALCGAAALLACRGRGGRPN